MTPPSQAQATAPIKTRGAAHLQSFARDWAYARASEASTLFLNRSLAKTPPNLSIVEVAPAAFELRDFDGRTQSLYVVSAVEKVRDELIFRLRPKGIEGAAETVFTFYPFRDIDDTWVVIQAIPGREEKPVRWAIPRHLAHRIEIMPDGYP